MSQFTDISFDLETLGQGFDAAIISLAAVPFNRNTGEIGQGYYSEIAMADAMRYGRVDPDTLAWWIKQDAKAKRIFADSKDKSTVAATFDGLIPFVAQHSGCCVWGNGSSFDITLIERHYIMLQRIDGWTKKHPWPYWSVRDMRTIVDAAGVDTRKLRRVGTHHNALDDAIFQAQAISHCFTLLRSKPAIAVEDEL